MIMVQVRVIGKKSRSREKEAKENVSITPWEYCEGCKTTVQAFVRKTTLKLGEMHAAGEAQMKAVDAGDLVKDLCEYQDMKLYRPFVRWTCLKILGENSTEFVLPFEGSFSASMMNVKKDIYEKTRELCVDTYEACTPRAFDKGNLEPEKRNICSACKIIATDLETSNKVLAASSSLPDMVDAVCEGLGYLHQPYTWLESHCETMVEDHFDDIVETLVFRNKVLKTGAHPDKPFGDLLCGELYGCNKQKEEELVKKEKEKAKAKLKKQKRSAGSARSELRLRP